MIRENINVNDIKGVPVHVEFMNPFCNYEDEFSGVQ